MELPRYGMGASEYVDHVRRFWLIERICHKKKAVPLEDGTPGEKITHLRPPSDVILAFWIAYLGQGP